MHMFRSHTSIVRFVLLLSCELGISHSLPSQTPPTMITSVAWSSDGQYLASGSNNGLVVCWDVSSGKTKWQWQGSAHGIYKLYFDTRRQAFLVLEKYGDAVFLNSATGDASLRLNLDFPERDKQYVAVLSVAGFDDTSETLSLAGNLLPAVHILDLTKVSGAPKQQSLHIGKLIDWLHPPSIKDSDKSSFMIHTIRPDASSANMGDFSVSAMDDDHLVDLSTCKDGLRTLGVTEAGWLVSWDLTGKENPSYRRQVVTQGQGSNYLLDVQCGTNNLAVTTGTTGKYGTIQLWDATEGVMTDHTDTGSTSLIELGVAFSSDGKLLVSNGDLAYIFWKTDTNRLIRLGRMYHEGSLSPSNEIQMNLAFLPGTHLLGAGEGTAVLIVDIDKGKLKCLSNDCGGMSFRFDNSGDEISH
jgi:WD40 repeat protein